MIRVHTRALPLFAFALSTLFAGSVAAATLVGPEYPAPGGNTYSAVGDAGDAGGAAASYGTFDAGAFNELYWGPQWGTDPGPRAGLDGVLHDLDFLSISGTTAIWEGLTSYTSPGGPGPASCVSCPIRLEIDIAGLGANPWVLEAGVTGLSGLAPGIGAVIDNSLGLDFVATFEFLADLGGGYTAINPIPASGGMTVSSVSSAFYSVPEPSATLLLGLGLLGVAVRRNRAG